MLSPSMPESLSNDLLTVIYWAETLVILVQDCVLVSAPQLLLGSH